MDIYVVSPSNGLLFHMSLYLESQDSVELDVPVLFLIFNRPQISDQTFEGIRKARPSSLYVAADGPRPDRPEDAELCRKACDIIKKVDWPCQVHTLLRDSNLGCEAAVSSAITWFFENEEMGIILEDDCLPEPSFFPFCRELLLKYRDDPRVMMIAGTNYFFGKEVENSYFLSYYFSVWGWATWRRAWSLYNRDMEGWPSIRDGNLLRRLHGRRGAKLIRDYFDAAYSEEVNTWATRWFYTCTKLGGLCATSSRNLISNIGVEGTHTGKFKSPFLEMLTSPALLPLQYPASVRQDRNIDRKAMRNLLKGSRYSLHGLIWIIYGPIKTRVLFRK